MLSNAKDLIQAYFDRWEIEVLHRDLKTGLGLGQAQVWSDKAVARLHSALVAAYSMLKLAALYAYGPERTTAFPPLPAWRDDGDSRPRRPSQQDLITMLRNDLVAAGMIDNSPAPEQALEHPFFPINRNERGQTQPSWRLPPRETYAMG